MTGGFELEEEEEGEGVELEEGSEAKDVKAGIEDVEKDFS